MSCRDGSPVVVWGGQRLGTGPAQRRPQRGRGVPGKDAKRCDMGSRMRHRRRFPCVPAVFHDLYGTSTSNRSQFDDFLGRMEKHQLSSGRLKPCPSLLNAKFKANQTDNQACLSSSMGAVLAGDHGVGRSGPTRIGARSDSWATVIAQGIETEANAPPWQRSACSTSRAFCSPGPESAGCRESPTAAHVRQAAQAARA